MIHPTLGSDDSIVQWNFNTMIYNASRWDGGRDDVTTVTSPYIAFRGNDSGCID